MSSSSAAGFSGLEAARGLARRGAHVTVIEHESRLMARQLDETGGKLLAEEIEALGMAVVTGMAVGLDRWPLRRRERYPGEPQAPLLRQRRDLHRHQANFEMARDAGLSVGRAIKVDSRMRTSHPDIYAVGECAEFDGQVFGLVGPGLEQADIAVGDIAGETRSYSGSVLATRLKVVDVDIFSMGDVEQLEQRLDVQTAAYRKPDQGLYYLLALRRGAFDRCAGGRSLSGSQPGAAGGQGAPARLAVAAPAVSRRRTALGRCAAAIGRRMAGRRHHLQLHRRHARAHRRGDRDRLPVLCRCQARDRRLDRMRVMPAA